MATTLRMLGAAGTALWLAVASLHAQPCDGHFTDEFPPGNPDGWVFALATFDDGLGDGPALYVAGNFEHIGQAPFDRIARWNGRSWSPLGLGADEDVRALAVFDDGRGPALYCGGSFDEVDGRRIQGIGRWDGRSWSRVGAGLDGTVDALAVFNDGAGTALYAGGTFVIPGGSPVHIARWDGTSWSPVGSGVNDRVLALAVYEDAAGAALYAGGWFSEAGGVEASSVARWDGRGWSPLGAGTDHHVYALTVYDDGFGEALYAGGLFTMAGASRANCIARWDGEAWSALGAGVESLVYDLVVHDDGHGPALFVGGRFDTAGGQPSQGVARWDAGGWSGMGGGLNVTYALTSFQARGSDRALLVAGGHSYQAGQGGSPNLAHWDGCDWSSFEGGVGANDLYSVYVLALLATGRDLDGTPALYAGGKFRSAGGFGANSIARWNGATWQSLGGGVRDDNNVGEVWALALHDDGAGRSLYVAGDFDVAGRRATGSIARWDGIRWWPLGGPVPGYVYDVAVFDDGSGPALYAAGGFSVPDVGSTDVARWDGVEWTSLADDANGTVRALAVFDDGGGPALYVGGGFTGIGGVHARGVARWDGREWSAAGSGLDVYDTYDAVWDLAVYDDGRGPALYAGGDFVASADDNIGVIGSVARWAGDSWLAVGGGVFGTVTSLAVLDDARSPRPVLFATGAPWRAGGVSVNSIARYNGAFWSALDEGLAGELPYGYALTTFDDGTGDGPSLFVGGMFTRAGDAAANRLARWRDCPLEDPPAFTPCRYEVEVVMAPPHPWYGSPQAIDAEDLNDAGRLVGGYGFANPNKGYVWDAANGLAPLEPPPQLGAAQPAAINEHGDIAGHLGYSRAFVLRDGEWTILDDSQVGLTGINDGGLVVGHRAHPDLGAVHAATWHDGMFHDIVPPGATSSRGRDVNSAGQVVGTMSPDDRSFLWSRGSVIDLGYLPGGDATFARAINDRGQVTGSATRPAPDGNGLVGHAFLWSSGRLVDLGTLPGYRRSVGHDVNEHGMVVGSCDNHPLSSRRTGFMWSRGVMIDLDEAIPWHTGVRITGAQAIDNAGRIAANGEYLGDDAVVVLTPVRRPGADIDGDCRVTDLDLMILLFEWGKGPSIADLDGDGTVGTRDLLILLEAWIR